MKKNVWILNHYATQMYKNESGRHYLFAKNLIKNGYNPTIFCASTLHNSDESFLPTRDRYSESKLNNIPFVFVQTSQYKENNIRRVKNILSFYKNLLYVMKKYSNYNEKPDIIVASSVHPLTLVAGIKIAKKFNIPCICEVRDLWPESIVAYGFMKRGSILAKALYQGEKWIYKKADAIIMTWQGGRDYIRDQKWDSKIDIKKFHYISNGVDLESFDRNSEKYNYKDSDLDDVYKKNIVYTGAVRKVNNLGIILDTAHIIQRQGYDDIVFSIYGSGNEYLKLKERCQKQGLKNIKFKGRVEKKYIPSILGKSYMNLLHNTSTSLDRYGQSQNKFFEYLAAGKCILQTYDTSYNLVKKNNCGIVVSQQKAEFIAEEIINICENKDRAITLGTRAREASEHYDFKVLTKKLMKIIENTN